MTEGTLREMARNILNQHRNLLHHPTMRCHRSFLDDDEFKIMYKVLSQHARAEKKIGVGVESIFVQKTSLEDSYCLHVNRIDGSEEDFSYRYALGIDGGRGRYTWRR
jgi:hypothetical protein